MLSVQRSSGNILLTEIERPSTDSRLVFDIQKNGYYSLVSFDRNPDLLKLNSHLSCSLQFFSPQTYTFVLQSPLRHIINVFHNVTFPVFVVKLRFFKSFCHIYILLIYSKSNLTWKVTQPLFQLKLLWNFYENTKLNQTRFLSFFLNDIPS